MENKIRREAAAWALPVATSGWGPPSSWEWEWWELEPGVLRERANPPASQPSRSCLCGSSGHLRCDLTDCAFKSWAFIIHSPDSWFFAKKERNVVTAAPTWGQWQEDAGALLVACDPTAWESLLRCSSSSQEPSPTCEWGWVCLHKYPTSA